MKNHKEAIKTLKFIVINSSPLPINLANKIMELIPNAKLYVYYGLTEASRSRIKHSKDKQSPILLVNLHQMLT